jgi:hypothetical protein
VNDYFALAERNNDLAMFPWRLVDYEDQPYSARSEWLGCTYWFGNIPLGDTRVAEYAFPARNDPEGSHPIVKRLSHYTRSWAGNMDSTTLNAVRRVWAVPGHQQLADTLGVRTANLRAEFANPGWLAYTLLGSVDTSRVPVVFLIVRDETQPIDPDFATRISPRFVETP